MQVGLYVAGFPCTPYSMLGERLLLDDDESQQMWQTLKHIKETQAAALCHTLTMKSSRITGHSDVALSLSSS